MQLETRIRDVAEPIGGILLQTAADDPYDAGWSHAFQRVPVGLPFDDARDRFSDVVTSERTLADEHFVEHATERPHVGAPVNDSSACLFGAHVRRSPHDHAHPRRRRTDERGRLGHVGLGRHGVESLGQAEVEDFDGPVAAHLDVGWLQIAMHHPVVVRGLERLTDLARDRPGVIERQRAVHEPVGQRGTVDELEHEDRRRVP